MLTVRYAKVGNMRYVSHIDLMRQLTRTVLRAGVEIKYSEGFNPHALIFMSSPMPLGIASRSEYFTIDTAGGTENFVSRFNAAAPAGLIALTAYETHKNPNMAAKVTEADYSFFVRAVEKKEEIEEIVGGFVLSVTKKGVETKTEVADKIKSVSVLSDRIFLRLAAGNAPLRADKLAQNLNERFGLNIRIPEIVKEEQYVLSDGKTVPADEYLGGAF